MDRQNAIEIYDSDDEHEVSNTSSSKKVVLAMSTVRLDLSGKEMRTIMQFSNVFGWRGVCKHMERNLDAVFTTIKPTEAAILELMKRPFGEVAEVLLTKTMKLSNLRVADFTHLSPSSTCV